MSTLSLYHIASHLEPLLENGINEDGEISDELALVLAEFEGKGASVTAYILNMDRNAQMIRHAAEQMAKRAEPLERKAERMRQYLAEQMKRTGITEIVANDQSFSAKLQIERDASVDIFDAAQVPTEYLTMPKPVEPKPNKTLIAAAIKAGKDVAGARIVKRDRLTLA